MSAIHFVCPDCQTPLQFAPTLAGRSVRCRACEATLTVPIATAAAPSVARKAADLVPDDDDTDDRPVRKPTGEPPSNPYRLPLMILMGAYFPFLAAVCVGSLLGGVALLWWAHSQGLRGPAGHINFWVIVATVIGIVMILAVVHILIGAFALFKQIDDKDDLEFDLPDQWQEGLADLADRVAKDRDLEAPDVIRLHAASVAHIYQNKKGHAVLVIGGPAIAALPQRALAGIIAHELAHFTAGDTAISRMGVRWHQVMSRLDVLFLTREWVRWNPLVWLVYGYHLVYAWLWFANQRAEEYAADFHEVAHVGKEKAAATLVLISILDQMKWTNLHAVAESFVETNQRLDQLFAEQVRRIQTARPSDWADALKKCLKHWTKWDDTHPCLSERLDAIGVKPKKALRLAMDLSGEPASALFVNWPVLEKYMTSRIMTIVREQYHARAEFGALVGALARASSR